MDGKNYGSAILMMPATGAIVQSVSQTKGAIGYIGLAYMEKSVKDIKVSYDKGKTYIGASMETAKNKTYPVIRPLYYYYLNKDETKVKAFVSYVISAAGQKVVEEVGYVPLN
jgi:phosphate transport system substrate-binding protein